MIQPASIKDLPRYPVTAAVCGAALLVTGWSWAGRNIDFLVLDGNVWARWELWRGLTSTLPHVNVFHLAFNLYWFWTFGTLLEQIYGHAKVAGIIVLLAFTSMLAEFTLLDGGIGLSGVGYGFWGMLWVLERRDPRFAGAVDQQTSQMFIGWFFLCVVLTVTKIMPVANIAHGVGAATGALLGLAATAKGGTRWQSIAGLVAITVLCIAGAAIFWPWVNFSAHTVDEVENAGIEALEHGDVRRAVRVLEVTTRMKRAPARAWYNLGVAYQRAHRFREAGNAFLRAAQMPDADSEMRRVARELNGIK